ncbi:MAG: fasciclin domain-containing protein, partial [Gammaproteobacteria bacterium]|nr:fasciclin domain-containing protein [Gammaproteobacteria bacterium]
MNRINAKASVAAAILGLAAVAVQASGAANILDVAKEKGNFTTLAKAIEVAGLQDALTGNGPVTVFA